MIDAAMSTFRDVLGSGWSLIQDLEQQSEVKGLVQDWAQATWEIVVEAALTKKGAPVRLVVYGDGADCNGASSRVLFAGSLPTHEIVAMVHPGVVDLLGGRDLATCGGSCKFDRFVSFRDGWYFQSPPFDHLLGICDGEEVVYRWSDVSWSVDPLES